jgi:cytochrome c
MFSRRIIALIPCLVLIGAAGVPAHDTGGHGHSKHDTHRQEMSRVQERVPEEYRIMDRTPMTPHMSSLRRGGELFKKHCAACHGLKGEGDGPAAAGLKSPPASFRDLAHSDLFGPGEKYWIIKEGFSEAGMPGFEKEIGPADRWHVVNYIYFLQRPVRRQTQGHDH